MDIVIRWKCGPNMLLSRLLQAKLDSSVYLRIRNFMFNDFQAWRLQL